MGAGATVNVTGQKQGRQQKSTGRHQDNPSQPESGVRGPPHLFGFTCQKLPSGPGGPVPSGGQP